MVKKNLGTITSVIGPVVDVRFEGAAPGINNGLICHFEVDGIKKEVVLEVALQLENQVVRTIAMDSTDGLKRGLEVIDTEKSIQVPVGDVTLGRIFNVLGQPIDEKDMPEVGITYRSIHQQAPGFEELSSEINI